DDGGEETAERKLRRHDDRQENQRQDDDERSRAIEVVGELAREEFADVSAGAKRFSRHGERREDEAQERADAAEEERGARGLGRRGVDSSAPEVVPADDDEDGGRQIRRVPEQLERQLGEERADTSGEIRRHGVRDRAEEPDRI